MRALVFGATGQIGAAVLARLRARGWTASALSRRPHADAGGVSWLAGSFEAMPALPGAVDAVLSCGPLDAFARWFSAAGIDTPRVVAFGSTSVHVKQASPDPAEREVARRLREAESLLADVATSRGIASTVLRPTLVYGAARDATLSRIAALAQRTRIVPLPRGATGLRQPVHVDDLADAALACIERAPAGVRAYDLPGGEALPYRDMVLRVLHALEPPARLVELPGPVLALLARLAPVRGGTAVLQRMREDLVFDDAPARADLAYAPRAFQPTADMFPRRG